MSRGDSIGDDDRATLLEVAAAAISWGLVHEEAPSIDVELYSAALREARGCFVTLRKERALRGCLGSVVARTALVEEVNRSAYGAAFRDPRFPPLDANEEPALHIHISVLSAPTPVTARSEAELIAKIQPGVHGLVLRFGSHVGTFLPAVWDTLPNPHQFLAELKVKAGLTRDFWSSDLTFERYTTESFE
jgi:AmmeMemoRadiSam system protein A